MRIVFMGTPQLAVPALRHLVLNGYTPAAVYTRPDKPAGRGRGLAVPPVKQLAQALGLPVVQPASIKDPAALEELAGYKPDVIVIAAYGQILPDFVLELPRYGCINIHFSLLPRHRGAAPVAAAILAGDQFSGVSIMLVTRKLDSGPVLARAAVPIMNNDTTGSLSAKLSPVAARLLLDILPNWLAGKIEPQPQNEALASYTGAIAKQAGAIDWQQPALAIWRQVRAYQPWPSSYTSWRGQVLKVIQAEPLPVAEDGEAGRVTALADGDLGVVTGDGILKLVTIQLEGRRAVSAAEFVCGQRGFIGSLLPG